jgi:hypothetical protein
MLAAVAFPLVACATPTGEPGDTQPTAPSAQAADGTSVPATASADQATRADEVSDPLLAAIDDAAPSEEKSIEELRAAELVGEPDLAHGALSTQVATPLTCADGAQKDFTTCWSLDYAECHKPWASATLCLQSALDKCTPGKTAALAACARGLVKVYRTVGGERLGALHRESMVPEIGSRVEGAFQFAATPQAGASALPIYRCFAGPYTTSDDFPSRSATCEGFGSPRFHGYGFKAGTPGTSAVYRCRAGGDHFLSRSASCEGHVSEGLIGYAK